MNVTIQIPEERAGPLNRPSSKDGSEKVGEAVPWWGGQSQPNMPVLSDEA